MIKRRPRTANQLFMRFTKRYPNTPIVVIQDMIKRITDRRKARGEMRRENSRLRKAWQEILSPLQAHIQSVLVHQPMHKESNPAYYAFNEKYLRFLRALRDDLKAELRTNTYPKESLAQRGVVKPTIEGVAWTWWIPKDLRHKITDSYAKLPRTSKTNYRAIFPEPKEQEMPKVRQKLRDDICKEMTTVEMNINSPHLSDTGREYYEQNMAYLNEALNRLENLPKKNKTPKTYNGLFTKAERQANYPLIFKPSEGEPQ